LIRITRPPFDNYYNTTQIYNTTFYPLLL
jgi:hypothetical protein